MDVKKNFNETKKWILVVLIGVFAYWGLNNLTLFGNLFSKIIKVFLPFIVGLVLAFILNIPMRNIDKYLNKIIRIKNTKKKESLCRIISIILSILIFVVILLFVSFLLVPELINNIEMLIKAIPGAVDKGQDFLLGLVDKYPYLEDAFNDQYFESTDFTNILSTILNSIVNGSISFIGSVVNGFINVFMGLIFAIYILMQKEYLFRGAKKTILAYFSKEKYNKLKDVLKLSNKTFSNFISGQCVEAIILGTIIFLILVLFRFPYALLIGVVTAVTALVPIFGSIIALVIGAVLISITSPFKGLMFAIIFLVVQQIEGNLIYPKVVGKSVGLSSLWTLLAISVGGNLFGVVGMLVGLPLASIIYALFKANVNNKLEAKKIEI